MRKRITMLLMAGILPACMLSAQTTSASPISNALQICQIKNSNRLCFS